MPTVYGLLDSRFGGATETIEDPEVPQSTATDAIFVRQDPRRIVWVLSNTSANPIHVRPNAVASAAAGITVPSGGILTVGYPDDLHLAALEWHCVSPAGVSTMKVYATRFTEGNGQTPSGMGAF